MARYSGPVCRLCRREGNKLFLKGERCYMAKCTVERRAGAPGDKKRAVRSKFTEYGIQLREKQKVRRIYGVLERQFRNYFEDAERMKGVAGENLLFLLERRFDNIIFRMGFASSRREARQLVRHGHFAVNGSKVDIPSYIVKPGDTIEVREGSRDMEEIKASVESAAQRQIPTWLELNAEEMKGKVVRNPVREDIDVPIQEQLIVEFYSR